MFGQWLFIKITPFLRHFWRQISKALFYIPGTIRYKITITLILDFCIKNRFCKILTTFQRGAMCNMLKHEPHRPCWSSLIMFSLQKRTFFMHAGFIILFLPLSADGAGLCEIFLAINDNITSFLSVDTSFA